MNGVLGEFGAVDAVPILVGVVPDNLEEAMDLTEGGGNFGASESLVDEGGAEIFLMLAGWEDSIGLRGDFGFEWMPYNKVWVGRWL